MQHGLVACAPRCPRVIGSTVEEAFAAWSGRGVSGLKPDPAENPRNGLAGPPLPALKAWQMQAF
jgi:hypothetical protein